MHRRKSETTGPRLVLLLAAPRSNHAERAGRCKGGHGFETSLAYSESQLQMTEATIESGKARDDAAPGDEDRGPREELRPPFSARLPHFVRLYMGRARTGRKG